MSVDSPKEGAELRRSLKMEMPLYSDKGGAAARAWDVFDAGSGFSRVASFIIAPGGKVIYRYVGSDKRDRPTVADYIAAIEAHPAP